MSLSRSSVAVRAGIRLETSRKQLQGSGGFFLVTLLQRKLCHQEPQPTSAISTGLQLWACCSGARSATRAQVGALGEFPGPFPCR